MRNHWDLPGEGFFRNTGEDWLQNLLGPCKQDTRTRVLLLLWRYWFLRDDCIHNTGKESICRSSAFLLQYEEDLHKWGESKAPASVQWDPPEAGTVKLNTDAGFLAANGSSQVGAIARNHRGMALFSLSERGGHCNSVEEAEAQAILAGLKVLSELHHGPLILETDCKALADMLNLGGGCLSACFPVIEDIKQEFANFSMVNVQYANRKKNKMAHLLAGRARTMGDLLCMPGVPDDLLGDLIADFVLAEE
ncbi:hypothetical protein VPH35_009786 [Triticum aestivum]